MTLPHTGNLARLRHEFSALSAHRDSCNCEWLVRPISELTLSESGALGYMMSPVGSGCVQRSELTKAGPLLRRVVGALHALHSHSPVIVHGDPRLPNLIHQEPPSTQLFWVDLAIAELSHNIIQVYEYDAIKDGICILVRSIFNQPYDCNLEDFPRVVTAINACLDTIKSSSDKAAIEAKYDALAERIREYLD